MLKERLKFILKDTAIYGISNALSKFLALLTLPIIVHAINPTDFGIWNLLTMLGSVITAIVVFGMDSAVVRYYFDDNSLLHHQKIFSHGLFLQGICIAVFFLFGFIFPGFFLRVINLPDSYKTGLIIVFLWVPANVFSQYFQNWFKWSFQRGRFLILSLGLSLTNLFLLFLYFKTNQLDLWRILFINAVSYWAFVFLGFWWCRKYLLLRIDMELLVKLAKFGYPMMFVMLISILAPSLDRLFLTHYLDDIQFGIYSFCQKISIIMMVAVAAFQTAFGPFSFSIWEKPDAKQTFSRFHSYYIIVAGIIALGICSCGKPLILVIGNSDYLGSEKFLPFLVLGTMIYGLYSFASIGIFYSKKMLINLLALSIGLAMNVIVNFLLIPPFKEYGAAIGFLSGNAALVISGYIFSRKYYPLEFSGIRDAGLLLLLSCFLIFSNMSLHENIFYDSILKIALFIPCFSLVAFFFLNKKEKEFLFRKIHSISH